MITLPRGLTFPLFALWAAAMLITGWYLNGPRRP